MGEAANQKKGENTKSFLKRAKGNIIKQKIRIPKTEAMYGPQSKTKDNMYRTSRNAFVPFLLYDSSYFWAKSQSYNGGILVCFLHSFGATPYGFN